jgi:oxygen-dependent protoporphyrinogen oxidase
MVDVVILGGGISGLATAYHIQEMVKEEDFNIDLTLVEKEDRLGGKIKSVREKGFLCESGPGGFLDNKPDTLELAREFGLKTLPSNEASKKRLIFTGNRLRRVPESPGSFLKSDILSWRGKLRVFLEPFSRPGDEEDETIAAFGERHLGREAQEKLISPMVIGIYAGDSEKLSLKSCFPVMLKIEKEGGGSLLKAMFKRMKKAKKKSKARASPSPSGTLTSFKDGMETLPDALKEALDARIWTGKEAINISKREGSGFEIILKGEDLPTSADLLILALPAYSAAEALMSLDDRLSDELSKIPYVPASVVCMGYRKEDVPSPLDGFGFLVPKIEERRILGCRWDSSTFEGRSSTGHVLLWCIVGGAINPDLALKNNQALLDLVKAELKDTMGLESDPSFIKIFRHEKAIPQYTVGHSKRLEEIEEVLKEYPGLFITGNAFKGIGINDCTRNAPIVARKVIEHIKGSRI